MKLIITRHGETDYNVKGIMQGQKQSRLTPNGIKQAEALSDRLKNEKIDFIYTSRMDRSIDTSKIINRHHGLRIVKTKLLDELAQGIFENKKGEFLYKKYPNRDKELDFRPKGAESIKDLVKRVKSFLNKIPKKGTILIVAHKGVNKIMLTILLNKKTIEWLGIKQDHTCVNILSYKKNKFKLEEFNDISHLKDNHIKKINELKGVY
jgi:phosphoserine phosphatase